MKRIALGCLWFLCRVVWQWVRSGQKEEEEEDEKKTQKEEKDGKRRDMTGQKRNGFRLHWEGF